MLMMNDLGSMAAGMMPFDPMCGNLYEQQPPKPRFIFKMPRVVPDQKNKFETDELFRRLSRESDVRYTGYRDRPHEERQSRFQIGCREGHVDIVHILSHFIMNGVCVRWKGRIDLDKLDGIGCLEFDEERAMCTQFSRSICPYRATPPPIDRQLSGAVRTPFDGGQKKKNDKTTTATM
ncbi:hypothetical protein QTP88_006739 [Uroleucon formosanum]